MSKFSKSFKNSIATTKELNRNIWRSVKDIWNFSPGFIILYGLSSITNIIGSVGSAYLFGKSIDVLIKVTSGQATARSAYILVIGALLLGLLEQLSFQVSNIVERRSFLRYQSQLENVFNSKLTKIDMERYENQDFNALITRIANDAGWKPGNFAYRIFTLLQALIRLIAPGVILVAFAPWMLPILIIGALPSVVTEFQLSKIHWGFWQEDGDVNTLHWKLNEQLRYKEMLKEVKLFGLVGYLSEKISGLTKHIADKQEGAIKRYTPINIGARVTETSVVLGLTIWLIYQVVSIPARLTVGSFSFYAGMLTRFSNGAGLVASVISDMLTYNLYMNDYYKLMDTPQLLTQPDNPLPIDTKTIPSIEFQNVSFSYPGAKKQTLKDFSLTIKSGERIAFVGENGAGKTTLIKLLMRFYDVDSGAVLIGGKNIKDIDLEQWYEQIGVLFQDFNKYPFSIKQNIEIGRLNKQEHHVSFEQAIKLADLSDNLKNLPFQEDTILDSAFTKGIEPSGGQWQRVALARAFYRDANILILDEPTAAIDAKAEYSIFNNIFKHYIDRTAIIISHRFSTVRKADRIVVLNKGKVEEQGSHEQLIKKNGLYKEMFEKQAAGYR